MWQFEQKFFQLHMTWLKNLVTTKTQELVVMFHWKVENKIVYLLNISAFFQRSKTQEEGINFPSDLNVEEFLAKLHYEHK